jgi:arsenate reductase
MESAEVIRAATHPQRYRLLRLLRVGDRDVNWLVEQTGLAPNLVSHHLRELRRHRLVSVQQSGRQRRYALDERAIAAAAREFVASLGAAIKADRARPRVLFVCVHNAGRSQMAQAFFERAVGDAAVAESAGSQPAEEIHPQVRKAMAELGFRITRRPKQVTATMVEDADLVVDMGCGDAIPNVAGVRRVSWPVRDPSDRSMEEVRRIRDDIAGRTARLSQTLLKSA